MLEKLLEIIFQRRSATLFATLLLALWGIWAAMRLSIDAVPDITQPMVQINTTVAALAPEEVEKLVTFPIETEMAGLPQMVQLRSLSKFGLSQVTMTFADGIDLYRTRQLVTERLQNVELPPGVSPQLAPIATGLGEIFYYSLDYSGEAPHKPATRQEQLMALRQIQEYTVKPLLRSTPGVAEVNTSGGYEKQIVVEPDTARLAAAGVSLEELAAIIEENTRNSGGGAVEIGGEQLVIRSVTGISSAEEIAKIPLKFGAGANPILLGEMASVGIGSAMRAGASTHEGQEALMGAVIMLAGDNSRLVAKAVRERLHEIQDKLPVGVAIKPLYDRSDLVDRTIATVEKNLSEGALLVVGVLFLLLGNWRAAVIVTMVIPLSMLFAIIGMERLGLSGNLMSLGAVDFGLIIDGAVVMIENIVRRLGEQQRQLGRNLSPAERARHVLAAAQEVANPMFFGVLIITVVYLPVLALEGIEGKMFKPMALVVMLALGASLVLALSLMPVLANWFLRGKIQEKESWLVHAAKRFYTPLLQFGLRRRWMIVLPMLALFGSSLLVFSKLGAEFAPHLDEGDLVVQLIRGSSVGLEAALEMQKQSETILRQEFPKEIREIFSRIGTAEVATDPMNPNVADTYLMLAPRDQWRTRNGSPIPKEELCALISGCLSQRVPGQTLLFSQPIQMRFNEIMAGARADLLCKIYGDDFEQLAALAEEIREIIQSIPGGGESEFDAIGKVPMIEIQPERQTMRKLNLHAEDLNRTVEIALAGREAGALIEGNRRTPIVVRLSEEQRRDLAAMEKLPIQEGDRLLRLGQVAKVKLVEQVQQVAREQTQRRAAILVNVRGRDTASFVEEATAAIRGKVEFPDGYYFEFGGQYKNLIKAKERLLIVVPLVLLLIFVLIYASFGSLKQATLIFLCVPMAATGGIFSLLLRGMPFTISAAVGFIALSGIAVLNGIMLISFINQLRRQGLPLREAVLEGTLTRLRPKLMTALVASFGFIPMALATGAGAEVQRPLATVVIGGVLTSTFLTLLLVPVLYDWIESKTRKSDESLA